MKTVAFEHLEKVAQFQQEEVKGRSPFSRCTHGVEKAGGCWERMKHVAVLGCSRTHMKYNSRRTRARRLTVKASLKLSW